MPATTARTSPGTTFTLTAERTNTSGDANPALGPAMSATAMVALASTTVPRSAIDRIAQLDGHRISGRAAMLPELWQLDLPQRSRDTDRESLGYRIADRNFKGSHTIFWRIFLINARQRYHVIGASGRANITRLIGGDDLKGPGAPDGRIHRAAQRHGPDAGGHRCQRVRTVVMAAGPRPPDKWHPLRAQQC